MRLMRHVEALCDPRAAQREVEMQIEVDAELEVTIGLDEASLPNWHGSRRNAEVISGSRTAVSQSLRPGGSLHRGNPAYNKAKGARLASRTSQAFQALGGSAPGTLSLR